MLVVLLGFAALGAVQAQRDLTGHWSQRFHEDLPERGAGPEIGDYTGMPINDAARLRADTWDAAKWTMPDTSAPLTKQWTTRATKNGRSR